MLAGGGAEPWGWQQLEALAELVTEHGFAVFLIGMRDDHEEVLLKDFPEIDGHDQEQLKTIGATINVWPAKYMSKALNVAIDHLQEVAPRMGVHVDPKRIALLGHSAGGAGVLYAAASDCRDRIAAVLSLNASFRSWEAPNDQRAGALKFARGALHSGEHGHGELPLLNRIKVPTYIYGSQAEWNWTSDADTGASQWPIGPSLYVQVGADKKELYVDDQVDTDPKVAHMWVSSRDRICSYGGGEPLRVAISFLRRHLMGSVQYPKKPSNAKEWEVQTRCRPRSQAYPVGF